MAIDSIENVRSFLDKNEKLIDDVRAAVGDGTGQVKELFQRLEANREKAQELIDQLDQVQFAVGRDDAVRQTQKRLLGDIAEALDIIHTYAETNAALASRYRGNLVIAYNELAQTYAGSIRRVVVFSEHEKQQFTDLMKAAVLDTQTRKQRAAILAGAVGLTKVVLKAATRFVA